MTGRLAIDQGTTSTKAYRSGADGAAVAVGARSHRQIHPRPGWVEHDPAELLRDIRALIEAAGPCAVAALANQGETVVAWDARTKRPLHNAIVWQDERTGDAIARLRADGVAALTRQVAGLPLDPYFSASKLRWLLDHAEGAKDLRRAGRLRLGTTDAFFLDALTGAFATDASTASRTSLMDLSRLAWSAPLCAAFGVPIECLPEIRPTVGDFGRIPGGPRVVAAVVDQQASLYGHRCEQPGDVKITFGTGAFVLGLAGRTPPESDGGLLATCAWQIDGEAPQYALEGGVFTAGAALDWAGRIGLFADHEALAALDGPSAAERDLFFVPAQSGLGCPHWDRSARGAWIGLGLDTPREDLCRAVLEGVALRAAEIVRVMARPAAPGQRVSVDGGLSRNRYFTQFLAAAIGRPIELATMPHVTALGLLALCAHGQDPACRVDRASWRPVECGTPLPDALHARFADAVSRTRGWAAGTRSPDPQP